MYICVCILHLLIEVWVVGLGVWGFRPEGGVLFLFLGGGWGGGGGGVGVPIVHGLYILEQSPESLLFCSGKKLHTYSRWFECSVASPIM